MKKRNYQTYFNHYSIIGILLGVLNIFLTSYQINKIITFIFFVSFFTFLILSGIILLIWLYYPTIKLFILKNKKLAIFGVLFMILVGFLIFLYFQLGWKKTLEIFAVFFMNLVIYTFYSILKK